MKHGPLYLKVSFNPTCAQKRERVVEKTEKKHFWPNYLGRVALLRVLQYGIAIVPLCQNFNGIYGPEKIGTCQKNSSLFILLLRQLVTFRYAISAQPQFSNKRGYLEDHVHPELPFRSRKTHSLLSIF